MAPSQMKQTISEEQIHEEAHRRMRDERDRRNANLKADREKFWNLGPKKTTRRPATN